MDKLLVEYIKQRNTAVATYVRTASTVDRNVEEAERIKVEHEKCNEIHAALIASHVVQNHF